MKHNIKNIFIQILISFPACRFCNAYLFYPHTKLYTTISIAKLYPITPEQDYILFSRFKSSHCYRIEIFKLLPFYTLGKTIPYAPHAILDPTILFPIFNLIPTCRLWNLYPIISTQRNTLLYWFKSSLYNPFADIQIYSLISPRQKPNILSHET